MFNTDEWNFMDVTSDYGVKNGYDLDARLIVIQKDGGFVLTIDADKSVKFEKTKKVDKNGVPDNASIFEVKNDFSYRRGCFTNSLWYKRGKNVAFRVTRMSEG